MLGLLLLASRHKLHGMSFARLGGNFYLDSPEQDGVDDAFTDKLALV